MKRRAFLLLVSCIWLPMIVLGGTGNATVSSLSTPKVVNFGALFTENSVIGSSVMPAILAAVGDVNADSNILSGTKLNVVLQDTNCSGFIGTIDGKGFFFSTIIFLFVLKLLSSQQYWCLTDIL